MQATWLSACQPQPMIPSVFASGFREVLGRDAAGGARAQLAQLVGLDHRRQLGLLRVEEDDDERGATRQPRVGLDARQPELAVGGGHDGERAVAEAHPGARPVLDLAAREPLEAGLDRRQSIGGREEVGDLGFGQIERQAAKPIAALARRRSSRRNTAATLGSRAPVAQGIERCPAEAEVARSNRAGRMPRRALRCARFHGGNPVSPVCPLPGVHNENGAGKAGTSWLSSPTRLGGMAVLRIAALTALAATCVGSSAAASHSAGSEPKTWSTYQLIDVRNAGNPVAMIELRHRRIGRDSVSIQTHLLLRAARHWRDATPRGLKWGIEDAYFVDRRNGWLVTNECAAGKGAMYRTRNGGRTWRRLPWRFTHGCAAGSGFRLVFLDRRRGWVIAPSPTAPRGEIFRTQDAGMTWAYNDTSPTGVPCARRGGLHDRAGGLGDRPLVAPRGSSAAKDLRCGRPKPTDASASSLLRAGLLRRHRDRDGQAPWRRDLLSDGQRGPKLGRRRPPRCTGLAVPGFQGLDRPQLVGSTSAARRPSSS